MRGCCRSSPQEQRRSWSRGVPPWLPNNWQETTLLLLMGPRIYFRRSKNNGTSNPNLQVLLQFVAALLNVTTALHRLGNETRGRRRVVQSIEDVQREWVRTHRLELGLGLAAEWEITDVEQSRFASPAVS